MCKTGRFKHSYGLEVVGLDIGPSTIAVVGQTQAEIQQLAQTVRHQDEIRRLERRQDRQLRANNPDC